MLNLSAGSHTIDSPYHLSLLLYDFCQTKHLFDVTNEEKFYDLIVFKFITYSIVNKEEINELQLKTTVIDELAGAYFSSSSSSLNYTDLLTEETFNFLKNHLISNTFKLKHIFQLIFKYNTSSEHHFLKVHLESINICIDKLTNVNSNEIILKIANLLNILLIYEFKTENDQQLENLKYESIALIQRCFKHICMKLNQLWSEDLNKLDDNYRFIYACLLPNLNNNNDKIDLLNLFCKINYQVDRLQTITSTFNDDSYPIISIIKKYSSSSSSKLKESYLWHRLFLYCFNENKLLLKAIIVSFFYYYIHYTQND